MNNGYGNDTIVVIAGLSNAYSHYIATNEEFGKYFFFPEPNASYLPFSSIVTWLIRPSLPLPPLLLVSFYLLDIQRYEGASTLYGPHTLAAYQMLYSQMATALAKGVSVPPGPTPPDISGKTVLTIHLSIHQSIKQTSLLSIFMYLLYLFCYSLLICFSHLSTSAICNRLFCCSV